MTRYNYNPFDPEGMANLLEKGVAYERYIGSQMANMVERIQNGKNNFRVTDTGKRQKLGDLYNSDNTVEYKVTDTGKRQKIDSLSNLLNKKQKTMATAPPKEEELNATEGFSRGINTVANAKGRETQVVPIPRHVTFGMPDYFTTKLIWTYQDSWDWDTNTTTNYAGLDREYRMNSIYDVDINDAGQQQPKWRDHYAAMYNYYTVLNCEYQIRFENLQSTTATVRPTSWYILYRTYGDIEPSSYTQEIEGLLLDPHMKYAYLRGGYTDTYDTLISGNVNHKDYMNNLQEVSQDTNDRIWTAVGSDPALTHKLRIMPRRIHTGDTGQRMKVITKLIYTVQFRELDQSYQFNTPT